MQESDSSFSNTQSITSISKSETDRQETFHKVRPGKVQKLLTASFFKIMLTIVLMFLIFVIAFAIAFQVGTKQKPTSAYQVDIVPKATIIVPQ